MGSVFKRVLAAVACAASLAASAVASDWTIVDLTPEGAGMALAVSPNGIVTGCRNTASNTTVAFVWANGLRHDLSAPAGSTSCGLAVNSTGVVAGRIDGEITVWDGANPRRLGVQGNVTAIGESGVVVGSANGRAFMWSYGVLTDLGVPGTAVGVNERGQVAILSSAGLLYMYEDGALRKLSDASVTNAHGLNDRGEIVGMTSFGHGPEPFIYDGTVHAIPAGGSFAGAVAINNAGQILGSGEGVYGYLIEDGQSIALDKLATSAAGSALWHHSEGKAINDFGWIVGQGGSSDFHAFLLMPKASAPAPAAAGNPLQRASERSSALIRAGRK